MPKCVDHKTTFPDTHRHFRSATEISRKLSHRLRGCRAQKQQLWTQHMLGYAGYELFGLFYFLTNNFWAQSVNSKGYRMHKSDLRLHLNCALDNPWFFTHIVYTYTYIYIYIYMYIYIYTHTYIYIYIWYYTMYIYIYMYTFIWYVYIYIYIYTYILVYIHMPVNN